MIKRLTFTSIGIILFLIVITAATIASSNYQYCPVSTSSSGCYYEHIIRVGLNGNEKISGGSTYSDFTDTVLTTLNTGATYTLSVDVNTNGKFTEYVKAWIDFNNDGIFSNDEEVDFGSYRFLGNHTYNKNFTVPNNAVTSETRMRVYLEWINPPSPCENTTFGEIEDYKIKISSTANLCVDGTTQPCGSGNCIGNQICTSGVWGTCNVECYGIGTECQNKCVNQLWYNTGSCNLNSCSCDYTIENCDLKDGCYVYDTGCENRDYFCQVAGCNYTFSNRSTDFYDAYVNYCSADTIRTNRTFHDFSCDGNCKDHANWMDDSQTQNCNDLDNWYNTTNTQWISITQFTEKEQIKQEFRDYTCSPTPTVKCAYSVNDTKWIDTGVTRNKITQKYCPASTRSSNYEWITRVNLNGNSKTSGSSTYSDFTDTVLTTLNTGATYTLYVDAKNTGFYDEYVKAWIDFNNNGIFSNDEEINLGSAMFYGNHTFNKSFTVPVTAISTETRMRVYLKYYSAPTPCLNASAGEVEDYKIKLL